MGFNHVEPLATAERDHYARMDQAHWIREAATVEKATRKMAIDADAVLEALQDIEHVENIADLIAAGQALSAGQYLIDRIHQQIDMAVDAETQQKLREKGLS